MKVIKKKIGSIKLYLSRKGHSLGRRNYNIIKNSFLYVGNSNFVA